MNNELNILWMYPDILNLHGDRGNIMAFEKIGNLLGIKVNIHKVEKYTDNIDFENNDILFFNVGEIKVMPTIIKTLRKYHQEIEDFVNQNKTIILIASSGCIFGKKTFRGNEQFEGLGLLDMDLIESKHIYGDDILFTLNENNLEIVGCQIKMLDTILHSNISLGTLKYGSGNNDSNKKTEGAKYKNIIYTNALGPVFIKNPWYTEFIIKNSMKNKSINIDKCLTNQDFDIELKSLEAIKKFITKKGEIYVS